MKNNYLYGIIGFLAVLLIGLIIFTVVNKKSDKLAEEKEDVSIEISPQPRAEVGPQGSETFCFRLNGREDMHLPALLGASGDKIYPNGLAGYNWSLRPESDGSEPYGVLPDGSIFVKKTFLARWQVTKIEIKAEKTGWQAIEMWDGKINEEDVYIYK